MMTMARATDAARQRELLFIAEPPCVNLLAILQTP